MSTEWCASLGVPMGVADMPSSTGTKFVAETRQLWWRERGITRFVAGVFEGGGAKGIVYRGALEAMVEDADGPCWFSAVAGASAGAITATLIAAGLEPAQVSAEAAASTRETLQAHASQRITSGARRCQLPGSGLACRLAARGSRAPSRRARWEGRRERDVRGAPPAHLYRARRRCRRPQAAAPCHLQPQAHPRVPGQRGGRGVRRHPDGVRMEAVATPAAPVRRLRNHRGRRGDGELPDLRLQGPLVQKVGMSSAAPAVGACPRVPPGRARPRPRDAAGSLLQVVILAAHVAVGIGLPRRRFESGEDRSPTTSSPRGASSDRAGSLRPGRTGRGPLQDRFARSSGLSGSSFSTGYRQLSAGTPAARVATGRSRRTR